MHGASAIVFAVLLIGGIATPAFADDTATVDTVAALDDAAFDSQFQCPESVTDKDAKIDEIQRYQDWAKDHHPDWSFRKRLDVRYGLLRRHTCAVTLANLTSSVRAPFGP